MTPEEVKQKLEWLRYYFFMIPFLKEKIARLQKEIIKRERQGRLTFFQEEQIEFCQERLQENIEAQAKLLHFLDEYVDKDFDKDVLIRHFERGQTYFQIGEETFYCEKTIIKRVKNALVKIAEKVKGVEPS